MLGCIPADFRFVCAKGAMVSGGFMSGQQITTGLNNTEGSWNQIASSNDITKDVYLLTIDTTGAGGGSNNNPCQFVDIGIDPSGGSNYICKIKNILWPCTQQSATSQLAGVFEIPIYIKAGSSVAIRVQRKASASTQYLYIFSTFYGAPTHPEIVPKGMYFDSIGNTDDSTTLGVAIADTWRASTTQYKGLWQLVGQARRNYWAIIFGVQFNSSALSGFEGYFDVAVAPRHGEFRKIASDLKVTSNSSEYVTFQNMNIILNKIPNGHYLYLRGASGNTFPSNALYAHFIGIG